MAALVYFAAGEGAAAGAGDGEAAGWGAAEPEVAADAAGAAAAVCGWAPGLIQQACTLLSRVSATLGSIWLPKRVRQRNVAWIWPPGQPKRS